MLHGRGEREGMIREEKVRLRCVFQGRDEGTGRGWNKKYCMGGRVLHGRGEKRRGVTCKENDQRVCNKEGMIGKG